MFYWLAAISFFVALLMISLMAPPSNDLKKSANVQADSTAFRMAYQHDAAVRFVEDLLAGENAVVSGTEITKANLQPASGTAYLSDSFVSDFTSAKSYIICSVSADCRGSDDVNVVTVLSGGARTTFTSTQKSDDFVTSLQQYVGSFPMHIERGEAQKYKGLKNGGNNTYLGPVYADDLGLYLVDDKNSEVSLPTSLTDWRVGGDVAIFAGDPIVLTTTAGVPRCSSNSDCNGGYCFLGQCLACLDWECSAGQWCNSGDTCTGKSGVSTSNSSGTSPMGTSSITCQTWQDNWSAATQCPTGQFQLYKSNRGDGGSCSYPTKIQGCINIPAVNSSVSRTGSYSYGPRSNPGDRTGNPILHSQATITCNGRTEVWDLFDHVNWWEANEICTKLGKYVPSTTSVLTNTSDCGGTARWSLINSKVGSSLNWSNGGAYAWTNQDYGNSCDVYSVYLLSGGTTNYFRFNTHYLRYALCGPAL